MIFQNYLPEKENEKARRLYRGEADDTQQQIGRLMQGLKEMGLEENTIVVFTADHDHSLGEHDYYFHHGEFLYDASIKVPLVIRWPGHLPAGKAVPQQARTIDLAPTLYALSEIKASQKMDGMTLTRYLVDTPAKPSDAFLESDVSMFPANHRRELSGIPGKLRALRTTRYKLILNPNHKGTTWELYDIMEDPEELTNLVVDAGHAEELETMQLRLLNMIPRGEVIGMDRMVSTIGLQKAPGATPDAATSGPAA